MMDFETAAKMSGARFVVLKARWRGWSARSASSCSMCTRREHGYTEVNPPLLVQRRCDVWDGAIAEVCRKINSYESGEMLSPAFR